MQNVCLGDENSMVYFLFFIFVLVFSLNFRFKNFATVILAIHNFIVHFFLESYNR